MTRWLLLCLFYAAVDSLTVRLPGNSPYYYDDSSLQVCIDGRIPARADVLLVNQDETYKEYVGAVYQDSVCTQVTLSNAHAPTTKYRIKVLLGDFMAASPAFGLLPMPLKLAEKGRTWTPDEPSKPGSVVVPIANTAFPNAPLVPSSPDDALEFVGYDQNGEPTQESNTHPLGKWSKQPKIMAVARYLKSRQFKIFLLPALLPGVRVPVGDLVARAPPAQWSDWAPNDD